MEVLTSDLEKLDLDWFSPFSVPCLS
jgi:hypothetical protein